MRLLLLTQSQANSPRPRRPPLMPIIIKFDATFLLQVSSSSTSSCSTSSSSTPPPPSPTHPKPTLLPIPCLATTSLDRCMKRRPSMDRQHMIRVHSPGYNGSSRQQKIWQWLLLLHLSSLLLACLLNRLRTRFSRLSPLRLAVLVLPG